MNSFKEYVLTIPLTGSVITIMDKFINDSLKELAFRYDANDVAISKSLEFWSKVDDGTKGNIEMKMMKILEETNEFLTSACQVVTKGVILEHDGDKKSFSDYKYGDTILIDGKMVENLKAEFIDMLNASVQYTIAARANKVQCKGRTLVELIDGLPHELVMQSISHQYRLVNTVFKVAEHDYDVCPNKFLMLIKRMLEDSLTNEEIFNRCTGIIERKVKEINV